MEQKPILGVIGGSGLYAMAELQETQEVDLETPFGRPSAPVIIGKLEGQPVAFLARHGIGHHISPSEVNYRANIYALKSLGVERIISISACGSLRDDYAPGEIVIPDQIFDLTRGRQRSFFGEGLVAHISVADPFCPELSQALFEATRQAGARIHYGGAFITIEGPRFSTRAESNIFRSWGMSLIGMTASPEAFLAREAELCYAVMAHVTDYDVWHISEKPVTVDIVIEILNQNTQLAQQAVKNLVRHLAPSKRSSISPERSSISPERSSISPASSERTCNCGQALASALITRPDVIPLETHRRLSLLVDKYLGPAKTRD